MRSYAHAFELQSITQLSMTYSDDLEGVREVYCVADAHCSTCEAALSPFMGARSLCLSASSPGLTGSCPSFPIRNMPEYSRLIFVVSCTGTCQTQST